MNENLKLQGHLKLITLDKDGNVKDVEERKNTIQSDIKTAWMAGVESSNDYALDNLIPQGDEGDMLLAHTGDNYDGIVIGDDSSPAEFSYMQLTDGGSAPSGLGVSASGNSVTITAWTDKLGTYTELQLGRDISDKNGDNLVPEFATHYSTVSSIGKTITSGDSLKVVWTISLVS